MFVDLLFSRFDTFGLLESIKPTKHKVNEHLSGGEWIRTGLLESIKPTKHNVNEHLSGGEWSRTVSSTATEMFVDLVFSRFDTF
jgi:ABC-type cobalamin transport system ATPase subunit